MKIFVFVDLHDELDKIESKIKDYDLVCFLGDLSNEQDIELAEQVYNIIDYYIPGNIDGPEIQDIMLPKNMHYRLIRMKNFDIFGFGLSNPTPFNTPGELDEETIDKLLNKIKLTRQTIFFTHAPPYGILDNVKGKNVGSKAIRNFVEKNKDKIIAHLFGHIHEQVGVVGIHYNLKPAYLGGYAVIEDNKITMY